MIKNNPNFNYKLYDKLFALKQNESDTVFDVVQQIMEILSTVYNTTRDVFYMGKEVKYTSDIDPTYCIDFMYSIGSVQNLTITLPLVQHGDSILINGNIYNPMIQMIDKPLVMRAKGNTAMITTNLGAFYTSKIADDGIIRFGTTLNPMFKPPLILYFLYYFGWQGFQDYTGVKFVIEEGCEVMTFKEYCLGKVFFFDKTNIKPEFKTEKFDILLNQLNRLKLDMVEMKEVKGIFDVVLSSIPNKSNKFLGPMLSSYMSGLTQRKLDVHQDLVMKLDIFSKHFMKKDTIWEELLRAFTTEIEPLDIKDLRNKRFRCYELYLLTFLKHVYNLGMNTLYSKITSVSKEKRLRIYDNIRASTNASKDDKAPSYSYDGGRNNPIMRVTEMTKVNQTGEGGLTTEMFVGSSRDIHESQYGTLCPITTPDREKCGVTLYLCPSKITMFDEMYYWPTKDEHKDIRSPLKTNADYKKLLEHIKQVNEQKAIDELGLHEVSPDIKGKVTSDEDEELVLRSVKNEDNA